MALLSQHCPIVAVYFGMPLLRPLAFSRNLKSPASTLRSGGLGLRLLADDRFEPVRKPLALGETLSGARAGLGWAMWSCAGSSVAEAKRLPLAPPL